jgi:hypothetical protein
VRATVGRMLPDRRYGVVKVYNYAIREVRGGRAVGSMTVGTEMLERGLPGRFEPIEHLWFLPAGRFAPRPEGDSGDQGAAFADWIFRGWDTFRAVVAATVYTAAVIPFPS